MGTVVDPAGVTYKNPLPLLLYHDQKQPIGTVTLRATRRGHRLQGDAADDRRRRAG